MDTTHQQKHADFRVGTLFHQKHGCDPVEFDVLETADERDLEYDYQFLGGHWQHESRRYPKAERQEAVYRIEGFGGWCIDLGEFVWHTSDENFARWITTLLVGGDASLAEGAVGHPDHWNYYPDRVLWLDSVSAPRLGAEHADTVAAQELCKKLRDQVDAIADGDWPITTPDMLRSLAVSLGELAGKAVARASRIESQEKAREGAS